MSNASGEKAVVVPLTAFDYKHFKPKKYETDKDWVADRQVKLDDFTKLAEAWKEEEDEKAADLKLFLLEVIWATTRSELTAKRAADFFKESSLLNSDALSGWLDAAIPKAADPAEVEIQKRREKLQRIFVDVLWVMGFAVTEGGSKEMKNGFEDLCATLERETGLDKKMLASGLETETVPQDLCARETMRKKQNQAKTKARYTIVRYNLLREHSDAFSRLLVYVEGLAKESSCTPSTGLTQKDVVDTSIQLVGASSICPNRMLSMILDVLEHEFMEDDGLNFSQRQSPLLALLERFPRNRITEVMSFQAFQTAKKPGQASFFMLAAFLIQQGLVDVDSLWSYLDKEDKDGLSKMHKGLINKYEEDCKKFGQIDLAASSANADKSSFETAWQEFNQHDSQKLRLTAALISINCWPVAKRLLGHLLGTCRPVFNHYVRSALSDLLKWLVDPALGEAQKGQKPPRPSLTTTFTACRIFHLGEKKDDQGEAHASGLGLQPSSDLDELFPNVIQVLDCLEHFCYTDPYLLIALWNLMKLQLETRKESGIDGLEKQFDMIVWRRLLPAVSLVPHNPYLSDLVWSVLSLLPASRRFKLYVFWETMYEEFPLKVAQERTKSSAKQILKRVVSNAEKKDLVAHQSHYHFTKLCHSNPMPAIDVMIKDIEVGFNVNMIQPYVECTSRCAEMTADVVSFMLTRACCKPQERGRVFLNEKDATMSQWLMNLSEFVGRFFKKHPSTDMTGLLTMVTKQMSIDSESKYKPETLIRVILENLVEYMGSYMTVSDLNEDQLLALAGGPRLRNESISIVGKKEDSSRKEKARAALLNAIVEKDLVGALWTSLSKQRTFFYSSSILCDDWSAVRNGGLKLLGLLFDGNHDCFLKLTEFLAQASNREQYMKLLPHFSEVFSNFEPAQAFFAIRPGLPQYGADTSGVKANGSGPIWLPDEQEAMSKLEHIVRQFLTPKFEQDGLSFSFYLTFWRLSLADIFTPKEAYEKTLQSVGDSIKQIEATKQRLERERDYAHSREYKAQKKELQRVADFKDKLKEESLLQKYNHENVRARLEIEKKWWFIRPSPDATAALVHEMICPRVLTSFSDALYCCHFVKLLIKLRCSGFQLLDFYNSWTIMLTQCIRCCSEREAQIFGVFLREMMAYVVHLRKAEENYKAESKDNPCFYRNYYEDNYQGTKDYATFSDIQKGHAKWEGRIFRAILGKAGSGLESEDGMEKRNALLLLSKSYQSFPVVEKYAKMVLESVERIRDREERSDVKTLAASLSVMLKGQKPNWVDKQPEPTEKTSSRSKDDKEGSRSSKNSLTLTASKASSSDKDKDRKTDGKSESKRSADSADGNAEKRSRKDEGDSRDGKEAKSDKAKESTKEAKNDKPKESTKPDKDKDKSDGKTPSDKDKSASSKRPADSKKEDHKSEKIAKKEVKDDVKEKKDDKERKATAEDKDRSRAKDKESSASKKSERSPEKTRPRTDTSRDGKDDRSARNALGAAETKRGSGNSASTTNYEERRGEARRGETRGSANYRSEPYPPQSRSGGGSSRR